MVNRDTVLSIASSTLGQRRIPLRPRGNKVEALDDSVHFVTEIVITNL